MSKIAIIGAAGFVGMELVQNLEQRGHDILAVTHSNGKFLLQKFKCTIYLPDEVKEMDDIDVVINLAYPNSGSSHHYSKRNREILELIKCLAGKSARIIHVSSLAVFGFQLEYMITPKPIVNRRDYLYVESKIEIENLLIKQFSKNRLNIVRLGNIWGKGSGAWTTPLINKLLFGYPVLVDDLEGYSNITDVANVVSYLSFLAELKKSTSIFIHHLAEFSGTKWSFWIQKICSLLDIEPINSSSSPLYPNKLRKEISEIFRPLKPREIYKKLVFGRFTASFLHSLVGILPEEHFNKLKQNKIQPMILHNNIAPGDETFIWVMSCQKEFTSVTEVGWNPVIDKEQSWLRVLEWMKDIGYYETRAKI